MALSKSRHDMLNLQALTIADHAEPHEKQILEYTRAIAFLGTPHRGSDLADWATIAGNMINLVKSTNTNILGVLKPDSEVLEDLTKRFHTMMRSRERAGGTSIRITCFCEQLPVSKAGKTFMVPSQILLSSTCRLTPLVRLCRTNQLHWIVTQIQRSTPTTLG